MAETASRQGVIAGARVQSRAIPCQIGGGTVGSGSGFLIALPFSYSVSFHRCYKPSYS